MEQIGIESLSFYTPHYVLDLKALAREKGIDADKFYVGIGQERMAIPPPDEDVVTMAANACEQALQRVDRDAVDTVIFATETGIDQSKAAAIYVHQLVGLPQHCRAFEVKQACCSSTAAVQMAQAYVALKPDRKVLVVASDVARYDLGSPGEATQGAGAVAMVISNEPKIFSIDPEHGAYTEDVMDFWRPNYRDEACVDGKYSIKVYLSALTESWREYVQESGQTFGDFSRFCYHLPFTRMAEKAHKHLARLNQVEMDDVTMARQISDGLIYSRRTGNAYTASLYVGLASLLDLDPDNLGGQRVGMFSYGSGCMATFFSGQVEAEYRQHLDTERHRQMLEHRTELTYDEYLNFYRHRLPKDGSTYETTYHETGQFRLAGLQDHKRLYEKCAVPATV
jgi:hydroxymethylglutaryl-CoA synthase